MPHEHPPLSERNASREKVRQELFLQLIAGKMLSHFVEELKDTIYEEAHVDDAQIERIGNEFLTAFAELSEEDKSAVLAVPYEVRARRFSALAKKAREGASGVDLVLALRDSNKEAGNTIGYHMSPANIPEPTSPQQGWVVKGTGEHLWDASADHSDEPTGPMAFYSLDYMNRYLKKPAPYLYIVLAKVKQGEGHGRSNAGTWGHAPKLDIIQQIDMIEVERELDARMQEYVSGNEVKKKEAA